MVACFVLRCHLVPDFFRGSISPVISVSPEPLPRSLLVPTHHRWVTHLLQAQDYQGLVPGPVPSPAAHWHFPLGVPGMPQSRSIQDSSSSGCLSRLVTPLSTQALKLQPGEPLSFLHSPVPNISPCPFYPSNCFLHPHRHCLGPGPHPFSPGRLRPPSRGWAFLLSLDLIMSSLCQDPREISSKMLLPPESPSRLPDI